MEKDARYIVTSYNYRQRSKLETKYFKKDEIHLAIANICLDYYEFALDKPAPKRIHELGYSTTEESLQELIHILKDLIRQIENVCEEEASWFYDIMYIVSDIVYGVTYNVMWPS